MMEASETKSYAVTSKLNFDNYIDLQSRLMLTPYRESEGIGAVVTSYTVKPDESTSESEKVEQPCIVIKEDNDNNGENGENVKNSEDGEREAAQELNQSGNNKSLKDGNSVVAQQNKKDTSHNSNEPVEVGSNDDEFFEEKKSGSEDSSELFSSPDFEIVGSIVIGICGQEKVDFTEMDFASILGIIREQGKHQIPINLILSPSSNSLFVNESRSENSNDDDNKSVCKSDGSISSSQAIIDMDLKAGKEESTSQVLQGRFQRWGTAVQTRSRILADEYKKANNSRTLSLSNIAVLTLGGSKSENHDSCSTGENEKPSNTCEIFLQSSPDSFTRLEIETGSDKAAESTATRSFFEKAPLSVTNSSTLMVRRAIDKPCPAEGHHYQWFKGKKVEEQEIVWISLEGACNEKFKPSSTDIGYCVKCVVSVYENIENCKEGEEAKFSTKIDCEVYHPIEADTSLFNIALKSFVKGGGVSGGYGACFTNIEGCGIAEGHLFEIHIDMNQQDNTVNGSKMEIVKIVDGEKEKIHDANKPIINSSALAHPSDPKLFELIFPSDFPSSVSKLTTGCKNNILQLRAPNRSERESFLLTLGVANLSGSAIKLNRKTLFFSHSANTSEHFGSNQDESLITCEENSPTITVLSDLESKCPKSDEYQSNFVHLSTCTTSDHINSAINTTSEDKENILNTSKSVEKESTITHPNTICDHNNSEINSTFENNDITPDISKSIKTELTLANKNKEPDRLNTEMDSTSNNNEKITDIDMGNVILKNKLREKDELVANLQQKLDELNNNFNSDKKLLITMRKENKILSTNYNTCNKSLQLSQKRIESLESDKLRLKGDYTSRTKELQNKLEHKHRLEIKHEKEITTLKSENLNLGSAVNDREKKLQEMSILQAQVISLSGQVKESITTQDKLTESTSKLSALNNEREIEKLSKLDLERRHKSLENSIKKQEIEKEKCIRSLENEKSVLAAAVDARETKLSNMSNLQAQVIFLKEQAVLSLKYEKELDEMKTKYSSLKNDLESERMLRMKSESKCKKLDNTVEQVTITMDEEKKYTKAVQRESESIRVNYQRLQGDRNSLKQKVDSLTKEISRICRGGMGIGEVENMVNENGELLTEITRLRTEKRKALEELDDFRSAHEASIQAQVLAGVNIDIVKMLEQKTELERVVSSLTEYLSAKEMQLETMRKINQALTEEIRKLANSSLGGNDI